VKLDRPERSDLLGREQVSPDRTEKSPVRVLAFMPTIGIQNGTVVARPTNPGRARTWFHAAPILTARFRRSFNVSRSCPS
jgi:hypothetical protein